jgi:hypothetical protein
MTQLKHRLGQILRSSQPRQSRPSRAIKLAVLGLGVAAGATSAVAAIVAVSGAIVLGAPASVVLGATESNVRIVGFNEKQCITLKKDMDTDHGTIPAGSEVSCHFFHSDPVTASVLAGRARFDSHIIDVISGSGDLDASDPPCRRPGVMYPPAGTEANRGLEAFQATDNYQIIDAGFGIQMQMDVPSFSDQLRVITCCGEDGETHECPALQD